MIYFTRLLLLAGLFVLISAKIDKGKENKGKVNKVVDPEQDGEESQLEEPQGSPPPKKGGKQKRLLGLNLDLGLDLGLGLGKPKPKPKPTPLPQYYPECQIKLKENCFYKFKGQFSYYCCRHLNILTLITLDECDYKTHYPKDVWCPDDGAPPPPAPVIPCPVCRPVTDAPPLVETTESEPVTTPKPTEPVKTTSQPAPLPKTTGKPAPPPKTTKKPPPPPKTTKKPPPPKPKPTTQKPKPTAKLPDVQPPAEISTDKLAVIKCFSCESTQGDSSVACKDNPKSTKIVFCKAGQVCRTLTYASAARGGSVIIRGCVDRGEPQEMARRVPKNCVENPPFLPAACDTDCGFSSCACTCSSNSCNNVVYPGQGWDACN